MHKQFHNTIQSQMSCLAQGHCLQRFANASEKGKHTRWTGTPTRNWSQWRSIRSQLVGRRCSGAHDQWHNVRQTNNNDNSRNMPQSPLKATMNWLPAQSERQQNDLQSESSNDDLHAHTHAHLCVERNIWSKRRSTHAHMLARIHLNIAHLLCVRLRFRFVCYSSAEHNRLSGICLVHPNTH